MENFIFCGVHITEPVSTEINFRLQQPPHIFNFLSDMVAAKPMRGRVWADDEYPSIYPFAGLRSLMRIIIKVNSKMT